MTTPLIKVASTKLAGNLPVHHGLSFIADRLVEAPWETHTIIAHVTGKTVTRDIDTDDVAITLRITAVEVIDALDEPEATAMLVRAAARRMPGGFNYDPATGEVKE